jgi:iron complex outermembrane receptor protein
MKNSLKRKVPTNLRARSWLTGALIASIAPFSGAQNLEIEEVVVTATKRTESVQEIPVAISVVDADTIEAMGIDEFTDITKISPSLTINRGDWATNSSFNLRGIGTNVFSTNIEPSVAVIVDDVPLVRSEQAFSDLSEIEAIEVLRGPQSTLFGKSASAGVINIRTKGPSEEFTGGVRLGATSDDETSVSVNISGPMGSSGGYRISGFDRDRSDGHIKNVTNGDDVNGQQSSGVRGRFDFSLSDDWMASLTVEHTESESNCCHRPYRDVPAGANFLGAIPGAVALGPVSPSDDNDEVAVDDATTDESESDMVSLRLESEWGDHQFVSVTSHTTWDYNVSTDVDGTAFDLLAAFTGGALSGGLVQGGGFELESTTQEFRLVSPASDSFEYVVGLFYSDISYDRDFQRGPLFAADWIAKTGADSMALFGQGTWKLSEKTEVTAGLRLNREEISHVFDNALTDLSFTGSDTESAVPGKISLQHFVSDDLMVFASVSRGYKGQGYDISSSFRTFTSENPVGSEDSQAFELGFKGTFLDGRVQVNPTLFMATYDDFQAQQARIVDGVIELGIANVGELETYGLETDFQALVNENLRVVGGFAYTKATIESFEGADCWTGQSAGQGCIDGSQDLSGKALNNSPELKMTLSAEYSKSLESMPFDVFVNVSYQYQDDVNFSLLADPGSVQKAYTVIDLSAGIVESEDGRYQVTAFVNNVLDKDYVSGIGNSGGLWGGTPVYVHVVPRDSQRYGGVRLSYTF